MEKISLEERKKILEKIKTKIKNFKNMPNLAKQMLIYLLENSKFGTESVCISFPPNILLFFKEETFNHIWNIFHHDVRLYSLTEKLGSRSFKSSTNQLRPKFSDDKKDKLKWTDCKGGWTFAFTRLNETEIKLLKPNLEKIIKIQI